jgi:hypothetical protein
VGSLWIIFYSIVRLLGPYGMLFNCVGLAWIMHRRVVDLFACWRGLCGSLQSAAMWKIVPSCLVWCLKREIDHERTVGELNSFFNTLNHWITALDYLVFLIFLIFLIFFLFLVRCIFCILNVFLVCIIVLF